jgi:small subunit ribosomal protein S16
MVKIRLRRVGAKKQPSYRIVVADSRSPRGGAFVDQIGTHNPRTDPPTTILDKEKTRKWLDLGAQPTATVGKILVIMGLVQGTERR